MSSANQKAIAGGVLLLLLLFGTGAAASNKPSKPKPYPGPWPPRRPVPPTGPGPAAPDLPFAPDPNTPPPAEDDPPLADIVKTFPEGGAFYQVRFGDTLGGQNIETSIAYRYLRREAFLAARDIGGLPDAEAHAFAATVGSAASRRVQAIEAIQCAWINDALYGTWGYGQQATPGPHGRAIRLLPQHPDNLRRLQDGEGVARNIRIGSPATAGTGNGLGRLAEMRESHELLWMPKLDRQALWDSGGVNLTTAGQMWPDGTNAGNFPPPWVMDRGIVDFSESGYDDWGC